MEDDIPRLLTAIEYLAKNNRTAALFLIKDGASAAALKFAHRDDGDGIV